MGDSEKLIDGKKLALEVREEVKVGALQFEADYGQKPGLAVVLVGERRDSQSYVRTKTKAAKEAGIFCMDVGMPATSSQEEIVAAVRALNADERIHGILVQLPLPEHVDEAAVLEEISVAKDADGFSALNFGKLCMRGGEDPWAVPCTAAGCVLLLERSGVEISGKKAVVLGRSNIVGTPVAAMLQTRDATVTVCHSRTKDIAKVVADADVVVAAIGKPEYVKGDWIKPGAVVVDVGINAVPDDTKKKGYRLVGDVDFEAAKVNASKITPVPGGVGPTTVAMLLFNVLNLAKKAKEEAVPVSPTPEAAAASAAASSFDSPTTTAKPLETTLSPVPKDIEISQAHEPLPILDIAKAAGLLESEVITYGDDKAKVDFEKATKRLSSEEKKKKEGSLVVVCGINPTPKGEGKSTTTIGVSQALGACLQKRVMTTIRQPSQGPTFGIKGGAAGGGYAQVVPMDTFNLHLTGDIHAVVAANNLVAAAIDARMFHESTQKDEALFDRLIPLNKATKTRPMAAPFVGRLKRLGITDAAKLEDAELLTPEERLKLTRLQIDPATITWQRVVDTCDRFLRKVEIGKAATEKGKTREAGFEIAVASEIMAVLALATSFEDLKKRLGLMAVGRDLGGRDFVTCDDLGVTGALAVLLKDALMPTLMQTLEGTPVMVHCGPFANIAHGQSSVVADKLGLKLVGQDGFVVTEAGFGADIGGEKNFDIKCRAAGMEPKCVVLVATVRALKTHVDSTEDGESALSVLARGCANVEHHVKCLGQKFGLRCVVAVNRFATDTDEEVSVVVDKCLQAGAFAAVPADHFAKGGKGALDLAKAVVEACEAVTVEATEEAALAEARSFRFLYPLEASVEDKLRAICKEIYLAADVAFSDVAKAQLEAFQKNDKINRFPICVAKTQYSLSTDPKKKGAPAGHVVTVRELVPKFGAGFLVAVCGDIMLIPGLPTRPGFYDMDYDADTGRVIGLF
eukprot:CAMPEP_0118909824 /NCGR_PEP_ID=MMETSP1166-20130328/12230_1 /TAXON_ID=1104430 /ORGANISM="Chrysoreinhardia sp, Strain CCMP3193" /LENGTH=969 /DNA_ID=CAMNT_0006849273 /DNA_START=46 /DNA_END=2955 /DNA_ORIENTATION=+